MPKSGGAFTGAVTTNSTIDGRDVAADGVLATNAMPKGGGAFTGAVTTNSTIDGRDVAADGVLATNALPKAGGALTGAVTTNSTFDGVDIATRDGILTSTTATAVAALPKAGGTMTGDTLHGDNVKAKFGTGNDLEIFHDGNKSNISDVGTGNLILTASNLTVKDAGGTNRYLTTDASTTATRIYHNNVGRLATTATGVAVTGSTVHTAGDVKNTISGTYKLFGANGTAGSNSYVTYAFEGDNDTGMNRTGNNNLQLVTAGAAAIKIDGAGIVTKPLQPAFMGLSATATNLAIQSWHTIVFSSERFDNNNDFSSNTFTAPVTGKYQMNVFIRLHSIDNAGHYYFIDLNTSNAHYYHIHGANGWSADPDYHTIGSSYVIDMDAGDTANVRLYQASGSAQTDIQANEGYFSGVLVA